ncbi:MAG: metal-dependent transcriptional regulator [Chitinophagales bacterium]|nr:metal-dependent transcriptional regulator [Chitinophagales bacterium]
MHSLTEENYLKAIYRLSEIDGNKITPTSIAEAVNVNAASVIDMIKKLTEKKLINYDKVKGAKLTEKGNKAALLILRKHRLWEVFLQDKLGYGWEEIHEIAEQLEHIQREDLADRLNKFLGYPNYDPHGDPIPKSNGEMPNTFKTLLSQIEVGKTCRVAAVKDTSTIFLQYLLQLSVSIGTKIKVIDKVAFDGSMNILIGKDFKTTVSNKFAESLLVD